MHSKFFTTMKKLLLFLIGSILLLSAACSSKDPVDQAVDILKESSENVAKATTEEEAIRITKETGEQLDALGIKNLKLSPEEQGKLTEAIVGYMQACMKSKIGLSGKESAPVLDLSSDESDSI